MLRSVVGKAFDSYLQTESKSQYLYNVNPYLIPTVQDLPREDEGFRLIKVINEKKIRDNS